MSCRNCVGQGLNNGLWLSWPAFVAGCPLDQLHISVVTLAEIRFGIELVAEPNRRAELNEWLTHKVRPMFDGRVLQVTEDIMLKRRRPFITA